MSLTGLPLILLSILATAAVVAATVLLWSRYGRWRLVSRAVGILLAETMAVLTIGLIANRMDGFYPSWQALTGNTGTPVVTAQQRAGRLDKKLHGTASASLGWHPAGASAWRFARPAMVITPVGYQARPSVSYPAILDLVDPGPDGRAAVTAAKSLAALSVVAVPTAATTAAALATLPADLSLDVRATSGGWAIVATPKQAPLAEQMIAAAPGRYGSLVVVGGAPGMPIVHEPSGVAVAVVRTVTAARHGAPGNRLSGGVTWLASSAAALWHTAANWAAGETSLPLSAPEQLPSSIPTGQQ